jgi:MinD superfamily P-loop ATPase
MKLMGISPKYAGFLAARRRKMKIAVLSGKGGTGKTTVSASLVAVLPACRYIDCDVEEPNGVIFLKPHLSKAIPVKVPVPEVDEDKCNFCGRCAEVCQFNAIAVVINKVLIFPEICHHCGACVIACPQKAIAEVGRTIGVIETNRDETFMQGKLNIGEPVSIPVISDLLKRAKNDLPVIIDCPPGMGCAVVEAASDCDYGILVTEPTPFGLHDLQLAVRMLYKLELPFGVVLNKATGNRIIHEFCRQVGIEIWMEIPYAEEIARDYAKGVLPVSSNRRLREKFLALYQGIERSLKQ